MKINTFCLFACLSLLPAYSWADSNTNKNPVVCNTNKIVEKNKQAVKDADVTDDKQLSCSISVALFPKPHLSISITQKKENVVTISIGAKNATKDTANVKDNA